MNECPKEVIIGAAETSGGTLVFCGSNIGCESVGAAALASRGACAFGGAGPPTPPTLLAPGWGTPDTSCGGVASPTSGGCAVPAIRFGGVVSPILGCGACLSAPGWSLPTGVCGAAWLSPGTEIVCAAAGYLDRVSCEICISAAF